MENQNLKCNIPKKMKYLFIILLFLQFAFTHVFGEIINNIEIKNETIAIRVQTSIEVEIGPDIETELRIEFRIVIHIANEINVEIKICIKSAIGNNPEAYRRPERSNLVAAGSSQERVQRTEKQTGSKPGRAH